MPQPREGDADGAGTPDCCAVRAEDWLLDLEGDAALAAARRALALVGEVGPALASALAATFLGDREEALVGLEVFVATTGAGTGAGASFLAAVSSASISVPLERASFGGATVAGADGTTTGSGVLSLDRASKNWLSASALEVDRTVEADETIRWPATASFGLGSALSSIGV